VTNSERLTALDASFLFGEDELGLLSVGGIDLCSGPAPSYDEFAGLVERRLHLLPRYRQRLAMVPLGLAQPRWVDDTHFRLDYHLRHTALPAPGDAEQLQRLTSRIFEQALDRSRPLWELWLVEGIEGGRFALIHKMHHAIVDGIASVDVLNTIFDSDPDAGDGPAKKPWEPEPGPSGVRLLAEGALERAAPPEVIRSVVSAVRSPRQAVTRAAGTVAGIGAAARAALSPAPPTPYNAPVGPHRRFTWQTESLADVKAIKDGLDGSLNDVVLTVVAGALGRHLRRRGHDVDGLELQVFVPVALRSSSGDDGAGNEVSGLKVPLPVGITDPLERFQTISATMDELKDSTQVMALRAGVEASVLAPFALSEQGSRLGYSQRYINLVVTNVPGPQEQLFLLGRELEAIYPLVPLGGNLGLGVTIVSYAGSIFFGFTADAEIVPDVGELPGFLHASLIELAEAAGVTVEAPPPSADGSGLSLDGEPWPGYDEQTVADIGRAVAELDSGALAQVNAYERTHKGRKGVRRAVASQSS